jgi:hypothetical protein
MMVRALQCNCADWENADITIHPDAQSKGLKLWRCHTCGRDFGIDKVRPIVMDAFDIAQRLSDYPVLDEEDYSRREYEEMMEWLEDEVSSAIRRNVDERIKDGFECDTEEVYSYLFDVHSVNRPDEVDSEWIEDAVLAIADKKGFRL